MLWAVAAMLFIDEAFGVVFGLEKIIGNRNAGMVALASPIELDAATF